ncbi:MAG: hypothetical protein WCF96_04920 [Eubacteriales bacterium]
MKNNFTFLTNKWLQFIFAFAIMFIFLYAQNSLISGSGDAIETWKVAKTFFSINPENSYVMYKGLWAIFPNVVFYQLSQSLGTDEFLFVKFFNAFLFAYITAIGLPYFINYILGNRSRNYRVYILIVLLFLIIRGNFNFISVDAPCIAILLFASNCVIKISEKDTTTSAFMYILVGSAIALLASFSGQFMPAAICLFVYIIIKNVKWSILSTKKGIVKVLVIAFCFILGFSLIKGPETYYFETRVETARANGAWLPSGKDWLQYGLAASLMSMDLSITPDNRGTAILINEGQDLEALKAGAMIYTFKQSIGLVLKYPADYIVRWLNRLFEGISLNDGKNSIIFLLFSYSALYLALISLKRRCSELNNVLKPKSLIVLAWILPSLVPALLHVELRYFMSIQILIFSVSIYDEFVWDIIKDRTNYLKNRVKKHEKNKKPIKINYTLIAYIVFILLCFMLYATQNELRGADPSILFSI